MLTIIQVEQVDEIEWNRIFKYLQALAVILSIVIYH